MWSVKPLKWTNLLSLHFQHAFLFKLSAAPSKTVLSDKFICSFGFILRIWHLKQWNWMVSLNFEAFSENEIIKCEKRFSCGFHSDIGISMWILPTQSNVVNFLLNWIEGASFLISHSQTWNNHCEENIPNDTVEHTRRDGSLNEFKCNRITAITFYLGYLSIRLSIRCN